MALLSLRVNLVKGKQGLYIAAFCGLAFPPDDGMRILR